MKRLWVGTANEKGMNKRRESEASLVDQAIKQLPIDNPINMNSVMAPFA
jgi:hypothetical protein